MKSQLFAIHLSYNPLTSREVEQGHGSLLGSLTNPGALILSV